MLLLIVHEFETLGSSTRLSQSDMDRLSQLRFYPFQTNQNIALSGSNMRTFPLLCQLSNCPDFKTGQARWCVLRDPGPKGRCATFLALDLCLLMREHLLPV